MQRTERSIYKYWSDLNQGGCGVDSVGDCVAWRKLKTRTDARLRLYPVETCMLFWTTRTKQFAFDSYFSNCPDFITKLHWIYADIQYCHIVPDKIFDKGLVNHGLMSMHESNMLSIIYYPSDEQ